MTELHALLYIMGIPLNTDEIMKLLSISRGNVSMTLRTLLDWGIITRTQKRDDRKNSDASEHEEVVKEVAATAVVAVADKPSASVADKPKKVISPEQKEKMLAGAKAAREAKKATAVAAAPAPASPPAAAPSIVTKSPKKVAKAAAAPVAEPAEEEWIRKTISGKKYLWNPMNNHCYKAEADGSQGDWAGLYDPKKSKIDDSAEEPVEFETA
jgi:DNA-binding MarR family transcriptional regulator